MAALSVSFDSRDERAHAVDHTAEIHTEDPIPVVVRRLPDIVEEIDPRVVAQDVHLAEHPLRLIRGPRHRRPIGDIDSDGMHLPALQGPDCLIEVILADIGDRDVHARGAECFGHAEADATAPARDEGRHACNVPHGSFPWAR